MFIAQRKKINNQLSKLLLIISLPFFLSAMEEKHLSKTSQIKKIELTKGKRRKLQRKRAKARPDNQSASEEFYDYFKSYLVATDNPNMPAKSLHFFRQYILFWTLEYAELGIFDKVLDTYFETTQTTPNTIIIEPLFEKETSFLKHIAELATHGNINAKILFKKLVEHGGDLTLKVNGSTTDRVLTKQHSIFTFCQKNLHNDKDIDLKHRKRAIRNTKDMISYIEKKIITSKKIIS